jgi:hypothetical protein
LRGAGWGLDLRQLGPIIRLADPAWSAQRLAGLVNWIPGALLPSSHLQSDIFNPSRANEMAAAARPQRGYNPIRVSASAMFGRIERSLHELNAQSFFQLDAEVPCRAPLLFFIGKLLSRIFKKTRNDHCNPYD